MHPSPSRRLRAWIVLVVLLGTGLRLYHLDAQAAWIDEVYRVLWAKGYETDRLFGFLPDEMGTRMPPRDLKSALRVLNAHNPPLNAVVLHAWIRATGSDSDFSARLPSAIFGALSILGTYLAGRRLLGARGGAWAATLVAFSPYHVFYAQEINHYALAACLVAFSYWCYFGWWERRSWTWGAGLTLTGVGALYTHYYAGLVLFFQALALLIAAARRPPGERLRAMLTSLVPYVAMAIGFAPYLRYLVRQLPEMTSQAQTGSFQGLAYFQWRTLMMGALPFVGDVAETLSRPTAWSIAIVALVLVIIGGRTQLDPSRRWMVWLNALGPVALVAGLYWGLRSNSILWPRYQLFFTFAQVFAVAATLDALRWWRWLVVAPLAVGVLAGLRFDFSTVKEDWRGAATAIASRGDDASILVYRPNLAYSLARYLPTGNRLFGVGADPDLPRRVALAAQGHDATWLVTAWPEGDALPSSLDRLLSCRYASRDRLTVDPGRVALTVTRYSQPRRTLAPPCDDPLMPDGPAPWERAVAGPAIESGKIDFPSTSQPVRSAPSITVTGFAFSTAGARSLSFEVDGREVARTRLLGLEREDVADAFPAPARMHALHSGFWASLDARGIQPGRHGLLLRLEHEDGTWVDLAQRPFSMLAPGARIAAAPR